MIGTEALRESFTFPADDVRQAHLGFLLAWLAETGDRDARQRAAAHEERRPIATTLDPDVEREELQPRVDHWNKARRDGPGTVPARVAAEIHEILEPEIRRRLDLTIQAIRILQRDRRRVNRGVATLEELTRAEHWYQYLRLEHRLDDERDGPAFIPSPETDRHAAAAAARFFIHEDCEAIRYNALIHDDSETQEDAIASGDAFRARIVKVEDRGPAKRTDPFWTLEGSDATPLRLREGNDVCVAGVPKRVGEIVSIALGKPGSGTRRYVVAITGWKKENRLPDGTCVKHACDPSLRGQEIVFVTAAYAGLARRKSQRVWKPDVPGGWLTHALPTGPGTALPRRVRDNLPRIAKSLGRR
jgi:hypothetical protein